MGRLKLFDEDGDAPGEDLSKIEIDREFAKRYEHNKKREELQRFEELKKQGRVDSSSSDSEGSSSEEDEELIKPSKRTDVEFFDALIKVKNQDPILRNKDAKLFNSDSDNEDASDNASEEKGNKEKKKKPMYLKDVVSKHLIEAGPEFDEENENNDEMGNKVRSYSEEQEELRREFLKAVEEGEDKEEGDLLRVKNSGGKEEEEEEEEEIGGKLDEYFGEDGKLDEDMMFLKDYFRNRMWIDDEKSIGGMRRLSFQRTRRR
ncbi:UNVERIFIED_CONTAM: protein kri1 [Sesamum radiatum]|uniref:Protein kri1 n=1 Tax=Sesamum radiatum TaxID=300843 RepID=A0AAW2JK14_SESRA